MSCDFTLRHYAEILKAALENDYSVVSMKDYNAQLPRRYVVIRHDLDVTIGRALSMSTIEYEHKCTATYLVRLHARHYNPLSFDSAHVLRTILKEGHEIGLHFEPGMMDYLDIPPHHYLLAAGMFLSQMLQTDITTLTQHYAGTRTIELPPACFLDGWQDLTGENGRNGAKYLSDSGGRWREGCLCQWLGKVDAIHATIHPRWWYYEMPQENF